MFQRPLPNYLRYHRRLAGLTQAQLAALLGGFGGDRISRHERRSRMPDLRTALALEIIFGLPVGELFRGVREDVRRTVRLRVRALQERGIRGQRASRFILELADRLHE